MKIGDMVKCYDYPTTDPPIGVIVGFNDSGEGGKDFVHVLCGDELRIIMFFDLRVVKND